MRAVDVVEVLQRIGFPLPDNAPAKLRHEAIADFQRGFAFWNLLIDGFAGPKTERALRHSLDHNGRASLNFRYVEFASKGRTDYTIKLNRVLLRGLEELRERVGSPIGILSGYRDPDHNDDVHGASNSQHLYGNAIDPGRELDLAVVRACRRFSGIGISRATRKVRHIDVRHTGPNTTGGSPDDPTIWFYA